MEFQDQEEKIQFFFDAPIRAPSEHSRDGFHSVLYLLRRELIETLGYDPDANTEADVDRGGARRRLFASLGLMFSGFDLLAKFALGDSGRVGTRFCKFMRCPEGGGLTSVDARLLWAIRNSVVHAFGLPPRNALTAQGLAHVGLGTRKEETLRDSAGLVVVERRPDLELAIVYIDGVFRTLISATSRYHDALYGSSAAPARTRFNDAFDLYGLIRIV